MNFMKSRSFCLALLCLYSFVCQFCLANHADGTSNHVKHVLNLQLRNEYFHKQFLTDEFSYLNADNLIKVTTDLPFRDIHADSFFRTGVLRLSDLRKYVASKNISQLFGPLTLKPWVPVEDIKNELSKCGVHYDYVSMTQQHFSYDKHIYGTMNVWKFACRHAFDEVVVFGVGMERFRFRFKDVLLNKLERYWASTARTITIRDMQKLMNYFSSRFAESMKQNFEREIKKLTAITNEIEEEESELMMTDAPQTTTTTEATSVRRTKKKRRNRGRLHSKHNWTTTTAIPTTTTLPQLDRSPLLTESTESYDITTTPETTTTYINNDVSTTFQTEVSEYYDSTTTPKDSDNDYGPEVNEANEIGENNMHYPIVFTQKNVPNHHLLDISTGSINLHSIPRVAKDKLQGLFPTDDIEELPYMTKDHMFQFVMIPITVRVMLAKPEKIPEILDIFQKDLSADSRDALENCINQYCEEPDEIIEILDKHSTSHYQKDTRNFFQDRALRFDVQPNNTLLAYATSLPRCSLEHGMKKKSYRARKVISSQISTDTRALWYEFLKSQVSEIFAVHHRPALFES